MSHSRLFKNVASKCFALTEEHHTRRKPTLSRLHTRHDPVVRVSVRGGGPQDIPPPSPGWSVIVSKVWAERDQTMFVDNDLSPTPHGRRLFVLFIYIRQRLANDTIQARQVVRVTAVLGKLFS